MITPIVVSNNSNIKNDNQQLSTSWKVDSANARFVQEQFNKYLNYKPDSFSKDSFLYQIGDSSQATNKFLQQTATKLKSLTTAQQNQAKNQMLSIMNTVSSKKLNSSTAYSVYKKYTNDANASKIQFEVNKMMATAKSSVKVNNSIKTNSNIAKNVKGVANLNYYTSNEQTTAGNLINKLNIATDVLGGVSAAAAVFSALEWFLCVFDFGGSAPWAVASSVISAVCGSASAITSFVSLGVQSSANQSPSGWDTAVSILLSTYPLGDIFYTLVVALTGVTTTVGFTAWAFPAVLAVSAIVGEVLNLVETFV